MKRNRACARRNAGRRWMLFVLMTLGLAACVIPFYRTRAANPPSGMIGPAGPALAWDGTAVSSGATGEGDCIEGINCDTFTITVTGTPTDWLGKVIVVNISWTNPANDYDLYIHKDSNAGPLVNTSGDGPPVTSEEAGFDPSRAGVGNYTVHVVYFAVTPSVDQYHGTATVAPKPTGRPANYVKGGISFSPNVTTKAPVAARDGEPSSRTDKVGNNYVAGIRGVPAGVDLWYFDLRPASSTYDPLMRNPIYRGQPDTFTDDESTQVGADGGGDVDLAVGFPDPVSGMNNDPPTLSASSLVLANISTQRSADRGATFVPNPGGTVTGGVPVDDRQWQEFYGKDTVYIFYRTFNPAVSQIQRSTDGGLTFGPARTAGTIGQAGYIDVHQSSGRVYVSGSQGKVCMGEPPAAGLEPLTYTCVQAAANPLGVDHLFFVVKVADDGTANGTVYVAFSNDQDIFLAHSTDKGATWSEPVRVSDGPETRMSLFPWIETGPTPGSVGVVWYGQSGETNSDDANWEVFYAQSFDANAATPTFRQVKASDHFIHGANISEGGLFGDKNRNLIDYFQISFDPTGAAVIAYTDDHNDFDGHTYVTRQTSGPSINGGNVPAPTEGAALPGVPAAPYTGAQVADFRQDVATGLLGTVPTDDPFDTLSIKYSCEACSSNDPIIVATMKVSLMPLTPPEASWRMNFAANVPFAQISPTKDYTFGLSDRGDQFFVQASTDENGVPTFQYGTAIRQPGGLMAYTTRGTADGGSINPGCQSITVKVAASKLNAFIPAGHTLIGPGSTLAGLRGEAFTADELGKRDLTRGGTQYTITAPVPRAKETFDFVGDIKTDFTVFRPNEGNWYMLDAGGGSISVVNWGSTGDILVPGDYDGDGKTDQAVWRPSNGTWYIRKSSDGRYIAEQWGNQSLNDKPVPGDYDGDGRTDIAVWRPGNGVWYILGTSGGCISGPQWGQTGDRPVQGDYDGDGKTDAAVFRPNNSIWYVLKSSDGAFIGQEWGLDTDQLVPRDYDGDGKTDVAVWRPSTGTWYVLNSMNGNVLGAQWGLSGDELVPADYDGDSKADLAVWRPTDGNWYVLKIAGGTITQQWGQNGDVPAPSTYPPE
jgi:hypothetical protein